MLSETEYPVVFVPMTSLAGCGYHPVEAHAPDWKQSVIIRSAVEEQRSGR